MGEGFLSFKKKIMKEFIIKCSVLSVALGLIAFGILFLLDKLSIISFHFAFSILIGVGTIALVFCATYFIFKPSDKKIAKRLDKTFDLNEKVQTMVSFKDDHNFIVELQREDTNNRLKNIPLKSLKYSINYVLIVLAVLGLGVSITALAYPKAKEDVVEPGDDDPDFSVTELQIQKLKALINDINKSNLNDDMKTKYIGEITLLITDLENSTKESEMIANVKKAINNILSYMIEANTNTKIGKALYDVPDYDYLENNKALKNYGTTDTPNANFVGTWRNKDDDSQIISINVSTIDYLGTKVEFGQGCCTKLELKGSYDNKGDGVSGSKTEISLTINADDGTLSDGTNTYIKYDNYNQLRQIAKNLYSYSVDSTQQNISIFTLQDYESLRNESILKYKQKVNADVIAIRKMLSTCEVDENDKLYVGFKAYADALDTVSSASDANALGIAKTAVATLTDVIAKELGEMKENRDIAYYAEKTLCEIFNLTVPSHNDEELGGGNNNGGSNIDGDDNGQTGDPNKGGSAGDGEYIYASRDYIFDYDTGELKEYGKYYIQYYDTIINLINEGSLSPEMEDYLRAYFEKLVSGIDNNNEN